MPVYHWLPPPQQPRPGVAVLLSTLGLQATGQASASGTAAITVKWAIAASGTASASGSAGAGLLMRIAASGQASASGTADMSLVRTPLQVSASGQASASGSVGLSIVHVPAPSFVTTISARYAAAIADTQDIATLVEVWGPTTRLATLTVDAGSITVDRTAAIRRTCQVMLTDPKGLLIPGYNVNSLLSPYGNELRLYRGITYPNGDTEYVRLGVFGIEDVDLDDTGRDLVITIDGMDRARAFQRYQLPDVQSVPPGSSISGAIQQILSSIPTGHATPFRFSATTPVSPSTPVVFQAGEDPWRRMQDLASSVGFELFFDVLGTCVLQPILDPRVTPVTFTYAEGDDCIATRFDRILSRKTGANVVIRDGQGSGTGAGTGAQATTVQPSPVRGKAQDTNPNSPTYVYGPYGQQVDYQSSTLYNDQAAAQAAANAALNLALGGIEGLKFAAVPKPDTDVSDVIKVTRNRLGLEPAFYVVDSFTMGLGHKATLDAVCRRVARTN